MKVNKCYLNIKNEKSVNNIPLSAIIKKQHKEHLWDERREGIIDTVVIHAMSAVELNQHDPYNFELLLDIFCTYSVSSHFMIQRSGTIWQLVPENKKAWHCGASIMPEPDNRYGVNEFSIGIELIGIINSEFTMQQYKSLAALCNDIEKRWNIKNYIGHEDIAGVRAVHLGLRKDEKKDPGPCFDWGLFFHMKQSCV